MPSAQFEKAWSESSKLKGGSNDELLELYAYGKITKGGEPDKGGMFNPTAKAKYGKWKEFKDAGITAAQAEPKYIELVATLKNKYGLKA